MLKNVILQDKSKWLQFPSVIDSSAAVLNKTCYFSLYHVMEKAVRWELQYTVRE